VKVNADELEAAVVARIEALARQPDFEALLDREAAREASVQEQRDTERREHLARELASLKGQFTRWAEMATRGTITEEQFREYNQDLLTKRTAMETELADVEQALENRASYDRTRQRVQEAVRDFPEVWARLNPDERRGVIDLLVERVTVDREGRTSTIHLKIAFLLEEVFTITLTPGNQRKPKGVDSLSPRQLAMLHHHRTGKKTQEIAEAMGVLRCCINQMWAEVRKRLGVYDKDELVRMATKRLIATLPTLPLGPDPKKPDKPEVPILSDALMEVFPLLASGATSKEVARVTGLAKVTVDNRRVRIIRDLGVQTIFEAAQKGRALGILT
jgi:DNA-binding NarL/FixJ family response regulator